ncbi:response regulator [Roseospira visakhapatnamensis]|uniref:CheY-like chemotaxis protein n=1 Tax=Roseospira visakhapatnamensis TaxID=390880 RepID=A0A7W6RC83_9PROT|nr:response regulator [Roseospira visakhapatnamensis]MBB4265841.1 CheY-like chemotaxis protein [Roseospira visakhapatnamensis]
MVRVLLAEDDADLRAVMARALERAGHTVSQVPDGGVALERVLGPDGFDLLLTDLEMPGRTGLEVIAACKREHPDRPVIATSGKGRPVDVALDLARRTGADAVIAKPFKLSLLVDLVARVAAGERPEDEARAEDYDDGDVVVIMPPNLLAAKVRAGSGATD